MMNLRKITCVFFAGVVVSAFASDPVAELVPMVEARLENKMQDVQTLARLAEMRFNEAKLPPKAPARLAADYISGKNNDFEYVALMTENDSDAWAVASLAFFLSEISKNKLNDPEVLLSALENYETHAVGAFAAKWKSRVPDWRGICTGKRPMLTEAVFEGVLPSVKNQPKKAPAIQNVARSAAPGNTADPAKNANAAVALKMRSISDISLKELTEARTIFRNRPRNAGLLFPKDEMNRYLETISNESLRKDEVRRLKLLSDLKGHIVSTFARNSYHGVICAHNGRMTGTIAMANPKCLVIRGNRFRQKIYWNDLPASQYARMLVFFAQQRLQMTMDSVPEKDRRRDAAETLMIASVLCDWYGCYTDSLRLMKLAIRLSPELTGRAHIYLAGRQD